MNKKAGILKYTESLILLMIWVVIIAAPLFIFQIDTVIIWERVLNAWMGLIPFLILFLLNHFLLVPFILFKNKKVLYLFAALILVIVFSSSLFMIEENRQKGGPPIDKSLHHRPPPERPEQLGPQYRWPPPPKGREPFPFPPIVNTFILSILVIGFDAGLRMIVRWSKLEQERTILEKENIQNQLAFLRNQVSPHFFMNTLNNIHALIDVNTEEAKEAIIKLSKLMRHLLYDSEAELVPLTKEVEFITSYTNLMKLRFSEKVHINIHVPEKLPNKLIPPLLFTSFVENAFKHGISYQNSSYINISFLLDEEHLIFETKNSIPEMKKESKVSGIGIKNSRKRLDIIYGNKYSLDILENNKEYKLTLSIPV